MEKFKKGDLALLIKGGRFLGEYTVSGFHSSGKVVLDDGIRYRRDRLCSPTIKGLTSLAKHNNWTVLQGSPDLIILHIKGSYLCFNGDGGHICTISYDTCTVSSVFGFDMVVERGSATYADLGRIFTLLDAATDT